MDLWKEVLTSELLFSRERTYRRPRKGKNCGEGQNMKIRCPFA